MVTFAEERRKYYDASEAHLRSMPLDRLGSLSCDLALLLALDASVSCSFDPNASIATRSQMSHKYEETFTDVARRYGTDAARLMNERARIEVEFWRKRVGMKSTWMLPYDDQWGKFIGYVVDTPGALGYAEAGIEDTKFIDLCITHEIDVESAFEIYRARLDSDDYSLLL